MITIGAKEGSYKTAPDYTCQGFADQILINQIIQDATNETIELLPGEFNTTGSIVLKSGITLRGCGQGKTKIIGAETDYSLVNTAALGGTAKTSYNHIEVRDITFESYAGSCLVLKNVDQVAVRGCEFLFRLKTLIRQGLFIQHCQNIVVDGNYIEDFNGNGLSVTGSDNFVISNNIVIGGDKADDGIDVDFDFLDTSAVFSKYGSVVGNTVRGITKGNGIRVENSNFISVTGNTVSDIATTSGTSGGIVANASSGRSMKHITITGNVVSNCVSAGIVADGSDLTDVVISSNAIDKCGQAGGSNIRGGIILGAPGTICSNNVITETSKTGTDAAAILVYKYDSQTIMGNVIRNSATGLRAWNGDSIRSYASLLTSNNRFTGNTTNTVVTAVTAASKTFNNFGLSDFTPATTLNDLTDVDTVTTPPSQGLGLVYQEGTSQWTPG